MDPTIDYDENAVKPEDGVLMVGVGPSQARLGFGSARLAFLEARLGLGSLAFGS